MITVIIPTRNRAYCIERVSPTYYSQKYVTEIIFVDDCSEDNTKEVIDNISNRYNTISTVYVKHDERKGAAASRITGYKLAKNEYILFGEDDAFLSPDYTEILFSKFTTMTGLGIISGRIIYLENKENQNSAIKRFGYGKINKPYFNKYSFSFNKDAVFTDDLIVPFTHALFLTKKNHLEVLKYDPFYCKGNGFREETDFQINAFVNGWSILVTNDTHCFHLHPSEAKTGGQRINRFHRLYWNTYYTAYMYDKYFDLLKKRLNIKYPKVIAKFIFATIQFYQLIARPSLKLPSYICKRIFG